MGMAMSSILGVDVGGTFTDLFLWADGRLLIYKLPSTPHDPAVGVLEGIRQMGERPQQVVHGSTVATNALIERKGARTALITTRGFADLLVIGRQTRPKLYELEPQRPPPLVPPELRLEVQERVGPEGEVLVPLDREEAEAVVRRARALGAQSLAICFLFSFLNPEHERAVAEMARGLGLPTSPSCDVLPEHREFERMSTTVVNAYLAPVVSKYLRSLAQGLQELQAGSLVVMSSAGGVMGAEEAGRLAVRMVASGPAAGVVGALWTAKNAGLQEIITLDMGGTSTDVALCPGHVPYREELLVEGMPIRGSTVDVVSVGAGGGSLARLDEGGALRVGPQSAGADPGPACYGRSLLPTITDAHMVLGHISPDHFLGGRMVVYPRRSRQALSSLARAFGGRIERAAAAVLQVAEANMERALRIVSVERGHDPRHFALVAFGGAGPLHACALAQALGMRRVLVPRHPGVLSALGMVAAGPIKEVMAPIPLLIPPDAASYEDIRQALVSRFQALAAEGRRALLAQGFGLTGLSQEMVLDMRYQGQSYEVQVPVDDLHPSHFLPRFHSLHRRLYAHSDPSRPVEVVNARLRLSLPGPSLSLPTIPAGDEDPSQAFSHWSTLWWGRLLQAPVYLREKLQAYDRLQGPALVVQMDATTLIPPGWEGTVDQQGHLHLQWAST
jgi:N-methylhydantoinase A/oxoprolinase/acetone carboxylase beta subunit